MSDEMHPAACLRVRAINGFAEAPREAVGTISGKAHSGIVGPVPDSLQPRVEFEEVKIHPEQSGNNHHRRSIAARDRRVVIGGREPQRQEFQDTKGFAEDGRVAGHLAVRPERLRLGGALPIWASFSVGRHHLN
jgi:hypothetical protein